MKKTVYFLFVLMLHIISCSSEAKLNKVFEKDMEIIKEGKRDSLSKVIKSFNVAGGYFYLETLKKMEYRVNRTDIRGSEGNINVTIKLPDLIPYKEEYNKAYKAESAKGTHFVPPVLERFASDFFKSKLENEDLKYKQKIVNIKYRKNMISWGIDEENSKEFIQLLVDERLIPVNYID